MMRSTARSSNRSPTTLTSEYQHCQLLCAQLERNHLLQGHQGQGRGCLLMMCCPQLLQC